MSAVRVLSDAPWLSSGPTARVLGLLNAKGEEARVVGGAVRNALLQMPVGDIFPAPAKGRLRLPCLCVRKICSNSARCRHR